MAGDAWIVNNSNCNNCSMQAICRYPELYRETSKAALDRLITADEDIQQKFNSSTMLINIDCRYYKPSKKYMEQIEREKMMENMMCHDRLHR